MSEESVACQYEDMKESPYLKELKYRLNTLIQQEKNGHVEYTGGAEADALYKTPECGIMILRMKSGEDFEQHTHNTKEWIINVKGSFETYVDGNKYVVNENEHIVFGPNQKHGGTALEDLECICITIPADEDYPNVRPSN